MALDITNLEETTITTGLEGKILAWYGTNNVGKSQWPLSYFPVDSYGQHRKGYNAFIVCVRCC